MVKKIQKIFSKNFLLFLGFVIIGGILVTSFTLADKSPDGKLDNGAYTNWIQNILEYFPENSGVPLKDQNVVKKSQSLADEKGKGIVFGKDGKIGVGITTPTEILDIRGETASVRVSTDSQVAKILLGEGGFRSQVNESESVTTLFVGDTVVNLIPQELITNTDITVQGKNVVLGEQICPNGKKITGTTNAGEIICSDLLTEVLNCNLNNQSLDADIRPMDICSVAPGETDIPYCTFDHAIKKLNSCRPKNGKITRIITCKEGFGGTINFARDCVFDEEKNGQCGEEKNSCQNGTITSIGETADDYTWQCQGIEDGATVSCTKPKVEKCLLNLFGTQLVRDECLLQ